MRDLLKVSVKILVIVFGLGVALPPREMAAAAGERERLVLDGEWDFAYERSAVAEVPVLPDAEAFESTIKVPGWWDDQLDRFAGARWSESAEFRVAQGPVQYLAGIGWHRKAFEAPREWEGRQVTLTVGRAITVVNVWLNGDHLGTYNYGVYTPFELDLTEHLRLGESNELLIAVDNTKGFAGGWAYLGNPGRASGITQSVILDITPGAGRVRDLYIEPGEDLEVVRWKVELETPFREERTAATSVEWEVLDGRGGEVMARGTTAVPAFFRETRLAWAHRVDGIQPWSDREPNLYWTRLRWVDARGEVLDTIEQRFGLRRYTYEGRRLFLNGKPIYLRGSFGHYYFPQQTNAPTDKEYWREIFQRAKSLGFNFVNFPAQVAPVEMLEVADEEGMILQTGDHMTVLAEHTEHYREVWEPIVRWTRRNPSLAIYGFGGERNYYEGIIEQYQKQHDLIKSLYSEALVMPQQAIRGIDYSMDPQGRTELTREPFPHHAERLVRYTRAADLFGHYSSRSFSYEWDERPHWHEMDVRFRIYDRPLIHHELFMGASYLRPGNDQHYTGRTPPYIYTDLQHRLEQEGMLDKWPVYFRNSARLQEIGLKANIEKVRKAHELAGFELLGLYDMHFRPHYTVGMLDEFMQFKTETDEQAILRYNDESVLLIDYDEGASLNRAYHAGTAFEADVYFSIFSADDFAGGQFEWTLTGDGGTVLSDSFPVDAVATGQVVKLGQIAFRWPEVRETTKLNLRFRLTGEGVDISNDWDFWVFPQREAPDVAAAVDADLYATLTERYPGLIARDGSTDAGLLVVAAIGQEEVEFLKRGGDVLLLGTAPFMIHEGYDRFRSGLGARNHHNVGTVIADHPIFADLPHEGWGDWHFYSILNGATPIRIDEQDMGGFDPIIEIISSAADIRKQAALFERRVGEGRLLVSTSPVNLDNPASVALLDGMLRHVSGPNFQPSLVLDPEVLEEDIAGPVALDPNNLLPTPDFRSRRHVRAHWEPYGAGFEHDRNVGRNGGASLRIGITPEEAAGNPGRLVGAVASTLSLDSTPSKIRFSAWYKTEAVTGEVGRNLLFSMGVRYQDGRMERVRVPLQTGTNDWQSVEEIWRPKGEIRSIDLHIGMARKTGTVWIDDVYLGPADAARVADASPSEDWSREPVTLRFSPGSSYRLDGGDWVTAPAVTISRQGVTRVEVRADENGQVREVREIRIDATEPILELSAEPTLDQAGGEYQAPAGTTFHLAGRDPFSGLARIEFRINDGDYQLYQEPFTLPRGSHTLSARAIDHAGNITTRISGHMLTGGETTAVVVSVE
jgi:beta-galactosidase